MKNMSQWKQYRHEVVATER